MNILRIVYEERELQKQRSVQPPDAHTSEPPRRPRSVTAGCQTQHVTSMTSLFNSKSSPSQSAPTSAPILANAVTQSRAYAGVQNSPFRNSTQYASNRLSLNVDPVSVSDIKPLKSMQLILEPPIESQPQPQPTLHNQQLGHDLADGAAKGSRSDSHASATSTSSSSSSSSSFCLTNSSAFLTGRPRLQKLIEDVANAQPESQTLLSEAELAALRARLNPLQQLVTQMKYTERPFTGRHLRSVGDGEFACVVCGQVIFDTNNKLDMSCGWPSFSDVRSLSTVRLRPDLTLGDQRVEVSCSRCNAHLGHVFDDGPRTSTTGLRYCVNSAALSYLPKAPSASAFQSHTLPPNSSPPALNGHL